jgi:hypothetical protein
MSGLALQTPIFPVGRQLVAATECFNNYHRRRLLACAAHMNVTQKVKYSRGMQYISRINVV